MGYSPWGHNELDTTEQLSTHAQKFPGTVGTLGAVGAARLRSPAPQGGCLPVPGLVSVHSRQGSPGHGSCGHREWRGEGGEGGAD